MGWDRPSFTAMVELYTSALKRRYFASRMSVAFFTQLVLVVGVIGLPFLVAFVSDSFWKKEATIHDQPILQFKHKLLFQAEGNRDGKPYMMFWSTEEQANKYVGTQYVRLPVIKSWMTDVNADGIQDEFHFKIKMPMKNNEDVQKLSLVLFFQVMLQGQVRMVMEAIATVQGETIMPSHAFETIGDLQLVQAVPFPVGGTRRVYESSLFEDGSIESVQKVLLSNVFESYTQRNESLRFEQRYHDFQGIAPGSHTRYFEASVKAFIRPQEISYVPGPAEALKFAWMQYLSILVIALVLWWLVCEVLFSERVLSTRMVMDTQSPKERLGW